MNNLVEARRDEIKALEAELFALPAALQLDLPVQHFFADKVYVRQLLIPAFTVLTGKIHKKSCVNIVLKGEIYVYTEEGLKHLIAPCVFISSPGVKRAGFAVSDTLWLTAHGTEHVDPEDIEDVLTVKTFEEFYALLEAPK